MKLIIQPEAGVVPITRAIKTARKSIDVFIFRFDRDEVEKALAAAVQRGVTVRALIAHTNRGGEARLRKLEQRLLAAGVQVSRSGDDLLRYHAKYMIADATLHLLGFNFTKLDMDKSRSFAVSTRDQRLKGAKKELAIYDAKVDDPGAASRPRNRTPPRQPGRTPALLTSITLAVTHRSATAAAAPVCAATGGQAGPRPARGRSTAGSCRG